MGTPIFEILTDGKLFIYDVNLADKPIMGDDIIRAFQFRLGTGNYYKNYAGLSKDWVVKKMECK